MQESTDVESPVSGGRRPVLAAAALALVVLGAGLATLPEYGITSDEPVMHYGGAWQLWAMGSSHPDRWKFKQEAPEEFRRQTPFNLHPFNDHFLFPGFATFFAAAVARVARHVPGFNYLDAAHAGIVLLHALTLFAFVVYLARLLGLRRALLIGVLYALFPSAVGHSHYNIKDWPATGFYAVTLVAFAAGVVENRARFILQAGVWLGLGLGCKPNPAFTVPTMVLWLPVAAALLYRGGRLPTRKALVSACLLPAVAALTFYVGWPYLRAGTPAEQWQKFADAVSFSLSRAGSARAGFSDYPFLLLGAMTPPIELVGLALAAIVPFRSSRRDAAVAVLGWIWLAIPLLRIAWPHSNYYDGNRLFLEYVPALALLAGMGLSWGLEWAAPRVGRLANSAGRWTVPAGQAAAVACAAWPVVQYHPYETTYYNLFVGGLGGAQRSELTRSRCRGVEWWCIDSEGDYWGFSYRNAMRDLNRLAESNATFHPCGNLIGPLTPFQEVRPDLRQAPRERADYFVLIPRRPFCGEEEQRYIREAGELVAEQRRDGGLIYAVYRRKR